MRQTQRNSAEEMPRRFPEVQREYESLIEELSIASDLFTELVQRLSPIRAERSAQAAVEYHARVQPTEPLTELGKRIRFAQEETIRLQERIGVLLSEIEV